MESGPRSLAGVRREDGDSGDGSLGANNARALQSKEAKGNARNLGRLQPKVGSNVWEVCSHLYVTGSPFFAE